MDLLLNLTAAGLIVGAVYALLAMGFAVVYRATGLLNFAQGDVMLLVAYTSYAVASAGQWGFVATLATALVTGVVVGVLLEFIFIRPMAGESMFSKVMVTIALAIMIRAAVVMVAGAEPLPMPRLLGSALLRVGPISLYAAQLATLGLTVLCCLATWMLFNHTRVGISMRAAACDEGAALLAGIAVRRVHALAWAMAGLYAGLAGMGCALMFNVDPTLSSLGLRAFPAAILGGLDSVLGSALGGLLIGLLESYAGGYLGRGMKDVIGFAMIVVVLMVKPYGLFGVRRIERV
ncbi:MAG: branched-chain amino acid ABC transporter permease [Rubrivivax sp.]|nr:branched-chain amino acid ABC transporter permease [Rubrivivax sp.]TXI20991.1 MAG: branched-chain amino acid ABC transporter permease [Ottowia sp.]HOZ93646.1 branched-chain amino acid ABC transporter permease [Ottowia sp.]HQO52230.1 branched-chain amino acid ABC transporter permease [Ottowia sp.]HQQ52678.1 branched-chain amino acid ABC transporter permease [Ottowia sp.]